MDLASKCRGSKFLHPLLLVVMSALVMGCYATTQASPGSERSVSKIARIVGGKAPIRVVIDAIDGDERRFGWQGGKGVAHVLPGEYDVTLRCDPSGAGGLVALASIGAAVKGIGDASCESIQRTVRLRVEADRRYIFYMHPVREKWWLWVGSREPRDLRNRLAHDAVRCPRDPDDDSRISCPQ